MFLGYLRRLDSSNFKKFRKEFFCNLSGCTRDGDTFMNISYSQLYIMYFHILVRIPIFFEKVFGGFSFVEFFECFGSKIH